MKINLARCENQSCKIWTSCKIWKSILQDMKINLARYENQSCINLARYGNQSCKKVTLACKILPARFSCKINHFLQDGSCKMCARFVGILQEKLHFHCKTCKISKMCARYIKKPCKTCKKYSCKTCMFLARPFLLGRLLIYYFSVVGLC